MEERDGRIGKGEEGGGEREEKRWEKEGRERGRGSKCGWGWG